MKNIFAISFFSILFILSSFNYTGVKDVTVRKIVIDAGHGGKDPGTFGSYSKEKDIALSIALETGEIIKKYMPEVEIIYTRQDDSFPTLFERSDLANKNDADLFISIHCNNAPWSNEVHGTETYVMGLKNFDRNFEVAKRENSVILLEDNYEETYQGFDPNSPESYILFSLTQSVYQEQSILLATNVEDQFKNRVGRKSRGVKQSSLYLLWSSAMPSILVETGFLSNPKEEKELNDKLQQTYIASGIYRAFRDYKTEIESKN
ncbi:MAG: N-acetylmuramoyl-L-alanine amidase [Reichenbachiella sp.]|uniref:N-acetylmuramoyl-L-alanine amidase family protein n=1 Tax=Reichenbachiella sp. TaxID=2184521 RepID=UPI00329A3D6C